MEELEFTRNTYTSVCVCVCGCIIIRFSPSLHLINPWFYQCLRLISIRDPSFRYKTDSINGRTSCLYHFPLHILYLFCSTIQFSYAFVIFTLILAQRFYHCISHKIARFRFCLSVTFSLILTRSRSLSSLLLLL